MILSRVEKRVCDFLMDGYVMPTSKVAFGLSEKYSDVKDALMSLKERGFVEANQHWCNPRSTVWKIAKTRNASAVAPSSLQTSATCHTRSSASRNSADTKT